MNMQVAEQKKIYVLLTKNLDFMSMTLHTVFRWKYTHASIGFDGIDGKFFSFALKGFRIEDPKKYSTIKKHEVPCKLYCISVSSSVYQKAKQIVDHHVGNSKKYSFSFFGVFMCLLKIAVQFKNCYFCSQFVAEVLEHGDVLNLEKPHSLHTPDDFSRIDSLKPVFTGTLKKLFNLPRLLPDPV